MMEFNYEEMDSELFVMMCGKPIIFSMQICPEKHRLQQIVEASGGELVAKTGGPHTIRLISKGTKLVSPSDDVFNVSYIEDCVRQQCLLDINKYRVNKTSRYASSLDVNKVMLGEMSWAECPRTMEPPGRDVSDIEDMDIPDTPMARNKNTRLPYRDGERRDILEYIIKKRLFRDVGGNAMWKKMERDEVCPRRTWMSMKEQYRKYIIHHLHHFKLSDKIVERLSAPFYSNSEKRQRTQGSSDSDSDSVDIDDKSDVDIDDESNVNIGYESGVDVVSDNDKREGENNNEKFTGEDASNKDNREADDKDHEEDKEDKRVKEVGLMEGQREDESQKESKQLESQRVGQPTQKRSHDESVAGGSNENKQRCRTKTIKVGSVVSVCVPLQVHGESRESGHEKMDPCNCLEEKIDTEEKQEDLQLEEGGVMEKEKGKTVIKRKEQDVMHSKPVQSDLNNKGMKRNANEFPPNLATDVTDPSLIGKSSDNGQLQVVEVENSETKSTAREKDGDNQGNTNLISTSDESLKRQLNETNVMTETQPFEVEYFVDTNENKVLESNWSKGIKKTGENERGDIEEEEEGIVETKESASHHNSEISRGDSSDSGHRNINTTYVVESGETTHITKALGNFPSRAQGYLPSKDQGDVSLDLFSNSDHIQHSKDMPLLPHADNKHDHELQPSTREDEAAEEGVTSESHSNDRVVDSAENLSNIDKPSFSNTGQNSLPSSDDIEAMQEMLDVFDEGCGLVSAERPQSTVYPEEHSLRENTEKDLVRKEKECDTDSFESDAEVFHSCNVADKESQQIFVTAENREEKINLIKPFLLQIDSSSNYSELSGSSTEMFSLNGDGKEEFVSQKDKKTNIIDDTLNRQDGRREKVSQQIPKQNRSTKTFAIGVNEKPDMKEQDEERKMLRKKRHFRVHQRDARQEDSSSDENFANEGKRMNSPPDNGRLRQELKAEQRKGMKRIRGHQVRSPRQRKRISMSPSEDDCRNNEEEARIHRDRKLRGHQDWSPIKRRRISTTPSEDDYSDNEEVARTHRDRKLATPSVTNISYEPSSSLSEPEIKRSVKVHLERCTLPECENDEEEGNILKWKANEKDDLTYMLSSHSSGSDSDDSSDHVSSRLKNSSSKSDNSVVGRPLSLQRHPSNLSDFVENHSRRYDRSFHPKAGCKLGAMRSRRLVWNGKASKKCNDSYTYAEDVEILKYIDRHKVYDRVKGRELWQEMENIDLLPNRSWQSMKERFRRRILPRLHTYLNVGIPEGRVQYLINKFSTVITEDPVPPKQNHYLPYTAKEDELILSFITKNNRYSEVSGKALWTLMAESVPGLKNRTWLGLKERFRERIMNHLDKFNLTEDEVDRLKSKNHRSSKRQRLTHKYPPRFISQSRRKNITKQKEEEEEEEDEDSVSDDTDTVKSSHGGSDLEDRVHHFKSKNAFVRHNHKHMESLSDDEHRGRATKVSSLNQRSSRRRTNDDIDVPEQPSTSGLQLITKFFDKRKQGSDEDSSTSNIQSKKDKNIEKRKKKRTLYNTENYVPYHVPPEAQCPLVNCDDPSMTLEGKELESTSSKEELKRSGDGKTTGNERDNRIPLYNDQDTCAEKGNCDAVAEAAKERCDTGLQDGTTKTKTIPCTEPVADDSDLSCTTVKESGKNSTTECDISHHFSPEVGEPMSSSKGVEDCQIVQETASDESAIPEEEEETKSKSDCEGNDSVTSPEKKKVVQQRLSDSKQGRKIDEFTNSEIVFISKGSSDEGEIHIASSVEGEGKEKALCLENSKENVVTPPLESSYSPDGIGHHRLSPNKENAKKLKDMKRSSSRISKRLVSERELQMEDGDSPSKRTRSACRRQSRLRTNNDPKWPKTVVRSNLRSIPLSKRK